MSKDDKKEAKYNLFDPSSKNLMGSRLTFNEWLASGLAEKYKRSFINASPEERERRLDLIIELACEYKEICKTTIFSTDICKAVMEDIINGCFERALSISKFFDFDTEEEGLRNEYAPIFKRFKELVEAGCKQREGEISAPKFVRDPTGKSAPGDSREPEPFSAPRENTDPDKKSEPE